MTEKSILKEKKGKMFRKKSFFCDKNFVAIHLDIVDLVHWVSCLEYLLKNLSMYKSNYEYLERNPVWSALRSWRRHKLYKS